MQAIIVCVYYLVALISALIMVKSYKKKTDISIKIGRFMLANLLMIIIYSINFLTDHYQIMSVANSISFSLLDIEIIVFLDFVYLLTGREKKPNKKITELIYFFAIIDIISMMLNPLLGHAVEYIPVNFYEMSILKLIPKWPYHMHIVFLACIIACIVILLVAKCMETPKLYWKRYYGFLFCAILLILTNAVFLCGFFPITIDISLLIYSIIGILMYVSTFHYLPLVTSKITRNVILYYINDPLILFDYEGKLAEYNVYMSSIIPDFDFEIGKTRMEDFIEAGKFPRLKGVEKKQEFEWKTIIDLETKVFQCKFKAIRDQKGRIVGRLFLFHDVTSLKKAYFELEKSMIYDSITGLYNKRSFYTQIPQWNDDRYWPISIAVCNVNGLKAINECYGTIKGDEILQKLADVIRHFVEEDIFVAKIDDGDIVIVLENTKQKEAANLLEIIKNSMVEHDVDQPIQIEYGIATKEEKEVTIEKVLQDAKTSMQNKKMLIDNSASSSLVDSLKQTLSESDYETEEHVERTRIMAARLGRAMELSDADIGKLELLAVLHDIGKVAIPHHVLKKQESLTLEERMIIQQHTVKGFRIAKSSPELSDIAECILSHHERWDGKGYPNALTGEEIPLLARIISAVDSYDVMVHDRPYHTAIGVKEAILELRKCMGTQFDPYVIEKFTAMLESEIKEDTEIETETDTETEIDTDKKL